MRRKLQEVRDIIVRYEDINPKVFREIKNDILESIIALAGVISLLSIGDLMDYGPGILPLEILFYFVVFLIFSVIVLSSWRVWEKVKYESSAQQESQNKNHEKNKQITEFNN